MRVRSRISVPSRCDVALAAWVPYNRRGITQSQLIQTREENVAVPITQIYESYIAVWNASDEEARRHHLAESLSPGASLVYPVFQCAGWDEILAALAALHQRLPGVRFVQSSGIEEHHGWLRVAWRMVRPDGSAFGEGVDVAEVAGDGRLGRVIGFHDPLPTIRG